MFNACVPNHAKLALARALKAAAAPKDIRTAVWKRYFGRDWEDALYKECFVNELQ